MSTPESCVFCCAACGFELDAVQLVARVRGVPEEQAAREFLPGGPLAAADTMTESQVQAYISGLESQARIRAFALRCHEALETTDKGRLVLGDLRKRGLLFRHVPDSLGVFLPSEAPAQFPALLAPELSRQLHAVYVYRSGPSVTALVLRGLNDGVRRVIPVIPGAGGVFMYEAVGADPKRLIVAQDEQRAAKLASQAQHYGGIPGAPVVSLLGTPLPFLFRTVRSIHIVASPGSPLSLADAFRFHSADPLLTGCSEKPAIRVRDVLDDMPASQVGELTAEGVPLLRWIADALIKAHATQGAVTVRAVLQTLPCVPEKELQDVLRLRDAPAELVSMFDIHDECARNGIRMLDGRMVYRRPEGFFMAPAPGQPATTPLSNFALHFQQIIRTKKGELFFRALLTLAGHPPESILLPETAFTSQAVLRKAVSDVFFRRGAIATVSVTHTAPGSWAEIRDAFARADGCPVDQEVSRFGASDALTVELPEMTVTEGAREIRPQRKALSVDPRVHQLYAGVRVYKERPLELDAFRELWAAEGTGETALAAVVSHMLFCLLQSVACRRDGERARRRHLALAESYPGLWLPTLRQFAFLTSGTAEVPDLCVMGHSGCRELAPLGDLPFATDLTGLPIRKIYQIASLPGPLICAATPDQTEALGLHYGATALDLEWDALPAPHPIDPDRLACLRREFPEFIRQALECCWELPAAELLAAAHPALVIHRSLSAAMGLPPSQTMEKMASTNYVNCTSDVLPLFFAGLRQLFYSKTPSCRATFARPGTTGGQPGEAAFLTNEVAYVSKGIFPSLLDAVNTEGLTTRLRRLTVHRIEHQLEFFGFLDDGAPPEGVDGGKYWPIVRDIWDSRVALAGSQPLRRLLRADVARKLAQ